MQAGQSGPRSFGQVMDAAFSIYTKNFVPLAKIAAMIFIPIAAMIFAVDLWAWDPITRAEADFEDLLRLDNKIADGERVIAGALIEGLLSFIGALLVIGASLRAASEIYLGREPGIGNSIRFGARRAGSMLWIILLMTLAMFGMAAISALFALLGVLIFIGLATFVFVRWWLAMPSLLLEDKRGLSALRRSRELVEGNWWRLFGALLVIGIFVAIVGVLLPQLVLSAAEGIGRDHFNLWLALFDVLNALGRIVAAPILAAAAIVLYYDLRVRKEGFDLELLVDQLDDLGATTAPEPTASLGSSQPPPSAPPPDRPA